MKIGQKLIAVPGNVVCIATNELLFSFDVYFSESRAQYEQEVYSQRMKESLTGASPKPRSSSLGTSPYLRSSDLLKKRSLSAAVHHDVHEWKLNVDEGVNGYVRDEFYFEQVHFFVTFWIIFNIWFIMCLEFFSFLISYDK